MKKVISIFFIAGLASLSTNAQENRTDLRDKMVGGLKIGANYSNVYDAQGEAFEANPKLGLAMGAFLAIPFGRYLGIQPEVLWSQRGMQASGQLLGNKYNITRTSNFLDFPLLLSFKPSEFITVLAGPQYSYLLSQKDLFTNGVTGTEQQVAINNDNIRRNILCATLGVDLTIKHIVLGARAGWDLQKNNGDGTSSTPRYKNMWYQGTIGYRFYRTH